MHQLTTDSHKWGIGKRFRTLFAVYFLFLMLDFTSSDELYPHWVYVAMQFYTNFWHWIVPWTGEHILHLSYPITIRPNGSGDTTYNYVLQLLWLIFALVIALIWTVVDRRRSSYAQFSYWSKVAVRYFLAYMLFVYGFVKVVKLQFPFPNLSRLTETYGESSPMGLAWTFIGYSSGYNIFIGGAEVLAGVLLFFKRTTLLGALLAMVVMGNVVAMNFAYDIPVKIFSLNLLFMALWIAWYDKDRLIRFFFLNKDVAAIPTVQVVIAGWKRWIQLSLKTGVILFALYSTLWTNLKTAKTYGDSAPKPPLYGIYDVEQFKRKGQEVLPLTTDQSRWKRMIINYIGYVQIKRMMDSVEWMGLQVDTKGKNMVFTDGQTSTQLFKLKYQETDKDHLLLLGIIANDSVSISMKRFDISKFPLVNRGFHWINEYPNNR